MASSVVLIQDAGMSASEINFIINSSGLTAEKNIPILWTILNCVFQGSKWKDGQKKKKTKKMVTSINLKISSATSSWHTDQPTYLVRFGFKIPWISFTKWQYSVWGQHWAEEVISYHGPPDSIFTLASGSLNTDRRFRNSFVLYLKGSSSVKPIITLPNLNFNMMLNLKNLLNQHSSPVLSISSGFFMYSPFNQL